MSTDPAARLTALRLAYGARRATLRSGEGPAVEVTGAGGGLVRAVEGAGLRPLLAALRSGEVAELDDAGCALRVSHHGAEGRVRVQWDQGPVFEDRMPVPAGPLALPAPPALAPAAGAVPAAPVSAAPAAPVAAAAPLDRAAALAALREPLEVLGGQLYPVGGAPGRPEGRVPAVGPADLGSRAFLRAHGVQAAYVAGAMAGGIASPAMVQAMAREGLLAFYGAGGLPVDQVQADLETLRAGLPAGAPWGANLLHNPDEPAVEEETVDRYLAAGVPAISASAFMTLTPAVLRYRFSGLAAGPDGRPRGLRPVFAKVSRPEVAERFLSPPPARMLAELVERGVLRADQAELAARLPVAEDITAEADSGGHTDRRALVVLLPLLTALRDRIAREHDYAALGIRPRVGAAGGIGCPRSLHGALALGADYVLTGSINQATVEAGTSPRVKAMLAEAGMADVAQGPAPDMFELGAQVQVLSRGTMYAQRARKLYEVYAEHAGLDAIPDKLRARIEKTILRRPLAEVEAETLAFWDQREPARAEKARQDPKLRMALTFRWYLGLSSRWARVGDPERVRDYQIWCGPAMGAFNAWARETRFAAPEGRRVAEIAWALLREAALLEREAIARRLGA